MGVRVAYLLAFLALLVSYQLLSAMLGQLDATISRSDDVHHFCKAGYGSDC